MPFNSTNKINRNIDKIINDKDNWADMIEERAEVKSIGHGFAEILPDKGSRCSSCSAQSSCATSTPLASFFGQLRGRMSGRAIKPHTIRVHNPVYAKPGDKVVVGVKPHVLLKGAMLIYLLPLLLLLLSAVVGSELFALMGLNREAGSILIGLSGFIVGYKMISLWLNRSLVGNDFEVVILRVIEPKANQLVFSSTNFDIAS